jgi:hypothetical protein
VINLANAKGRAVGSIELDGGSWGQFTYQVRKSAISVYVYLNSLSTKGRVIASGTGTLTFPEGDPVVPGTGPVPFTITL